MREIKIKGFTSVIDDPSTLVIASHGTEGSGKTRLITTAPAPVGIIALDRKCRATVRKEIKAMGKSAPCILMPEEDFIRQKNPMELAVMAPDKAMAYYRQHVDRIKERIFSLHANPDVQTIAIDTFGQFCEDIIMANHGRTNRIQPRDRGMDNQEIIDLLNVISSKHVILTHKTTEEWKNDKPTGVMKPDGWKHIGYHSTVIVEHVRNMKFDLESTAADKNWKYGLNVSLCQGNPGIEGEQGKLLLQDDMITFGNLATMIFPEEDWGI